MCPINEERLDCAKGDIIGHKDVSQGDCSCPTNFCTPPKEVDCKNVHAGPTESFNEMETVMSKVQETAEPSEY